MNLKTFSYKALHFLLLHLSITLISLPILVAWGLPLSLLSPLGNLLFAPVLTIFLLVSSFIFFCQLLCIPTTIITSLVNGTIRCCTLLETPNLSKSTLGFPCHGYYTLAAMPIIALALLHMRKLHTPLRKTAALATALVFMGIMLHCTSKNLSRVIPITCNDAEIYLVILDNKTTLIDTGALGRRQSSASWASHDLLQTITKQTGRTSIDHAIILQPGTFTFEALCALHEKTEVEHTYIPYWHGKLRPNAYRSFKKLCSTIKQQKRTIIRIGGTNQTLLENAPFSTTVTNKKISSGKATYPAIEMSCLVDNKKTCFYPAKHKKRP